MTPSSQPFPSHEASRSCPESFLSHLPHPASKLLCLHCSCPATNLLQLCWFHPDSKLPCLHWLHPVPTLSHLHPENLLIPSHFFWSCQHLGSSFPTGLVKLSLRLHLPQTAWFTAQPRCSDPSAPPQGSEPRTPPQPALVPPAPPWLGVTLFSPQAP